MTRERKQVYTRRITEANRTQLITIVYELAMEYMDEAIEAEKKSDLTAFADVPFVMRMPVWMIC